MYGLARWFMRGVNSIEVPRIAWISKLYYNLRARDRNQMTSFQTNQISDTRCIDITGFLKDLCQSVFSLSFIDRIIFFFYKSTRGLYGWSDKRLKNGLKREIIERGEVKRGNEVGTKKKQQGGRKKKRNKWLKIKSLKNRWTKQRRRKKRGKTTVLYSVLINWRMRFEMGRKK